MPIWRSANKNFRKDEDEFWGIDGGVLFGYPTCGEVEAYWELEGDKKSGFYKHLFCPHCGIEYRSKPDSDIWSKI